MTPAEAVHALLERGISEMKIAKAVGCAQVTINRLKRGATADCNFVLGEKLIEYANSITSGLLPDGRAGIDASALGARHSESQGTLIKNANGQPLRCEMQFRDGTKAVLHIPSGQTIVFTAGPGLLAMNLVHDATKREDELVSNRGG
ncbi:hypothetical protein ABZR86_02440 [Dyella marensis]|uniref:hypothetical protein n=1 Tax=Dyella TaxID=231454 RepID=UPI0011605B27|nr:MULTISPECIES: hypothetical protein [Dyella]